jgi:hypothetical protein
MLKKIGITLLTLSIAAVGFAGNIGDCIQQTKDALAIVNDNLLRLGDEERRLMKKLEPVRAEMRIQQAGAIMLEGDLEAQESTRRILRDEASTRTLVYPVVIQDLYVNQSSANSIAGQ